MWPLLLTTYSASLSVLPEETIYTHEAHCEPAGYSRPRDLSGSASADATRHTLHTPDRISTRPASQGSRCSHRGRARRRGRATPPLRTRTRCEASGARRRDSRRRRSVGPPTHAGRPAAALDSGRSCAGTPGRQESHDGQQSHGKSNQGQEGRHTAEFEAGAGEPCACRLGSCRTRRPPPTWGSRRAGRRKRPRGCARAGAPTWLGLGLGLGVRGKGQG